MVRSRRRLPYPMAIRTKKRMLIAEYESVESSLRSSLSLVFLQVEIFCNE